MAYVNDERVYLDELRIQCGMTPALSQLAYQQRKHGELSLQALMISEQGLVFQQLMRNRLIMGALRYGRMNQAGKPQYKRTDKILKCLVQYVATGNQEMLVDLANYALLEFQEPGQVNAHWNAEDDGDHCEIVYK